MPLLHLDAEHDLVQSIKLAERSWAAVPSACARRGCRFGARRAAVIEMIERARDRRP